MNILIQIKAAVNDKTSGSPVFNKTGNIIGILSMLYSEYKSALNEFGYVIPFKQVELVIKEIFGKLDIKFNRKPKPSYQLPEKNFFNQCNEETRYSGISNDTIEDDIIMGNED